MSSFEQHNVVPPETLVEGEATPEHLTAAAAVLKAKELIGVALNNPDLTTLRYLINLRDSIKDLDYEGLMKQAKRTEAARRKDHSRQGFDGEQVIR